MIRRTSAPRSANSSWWARIIVSTPLRGSKRPMKTMVRWSPSRSSTGAASGQKWAAAVQLLARAGVRGEVVGVVAVGDHVVGVGEVGRRRADAGLADADPAVQAL